MKNLTITILLILFPLIIFCQNRYSVIYEADENGKIISGNIEELKKAVQNGSPIRVGWTIELQNQEGEKKILEHWTDTKFLTIVDNNVYAQINSIYEQMTDFKNLNGVVKFLDNHPDGWVAIISTSGIMRQEYANVLKGTDGMTQEQIAKMVNMMETSKVKTKWAAIE